MSIFQIIALVLIVLCLVGVVLWSCHEWSLHILVGILCLLPTSMCVSAIGEAFKTGRVERFSSFCWHLDVEIEEYYENHYDTTYVLTLRDPYYDSLRAKKTKN